jgi:hypothetical protein
MARFFVGFLLIQALLFGAELTPWAQTYFVVPWTHTLASLSADIVRFFDPRVAVWLPPAFFVWYLAGPLLAWPIALLTTAVAKIGFADIVQAVEQQGHLVVIVSTLKPTLSTTQSMASGVLSIELNVLLYSFGFPMLVALTLAAGQPRALRTLLLGYAVLAPFVTWGLIAEFLKHIVFDAGPGGRLADRLQVGAARGDRFRVPVRRADPADGCSSGVLGADPPALPRGPRCARACCESVALAAHHVTGPLESRDGGGLLRGGDQHEVRAERRQREHRHARCGERRSDAGEDAGLIERQGPVELERSPAAASSYPRGHLDLRADDR